MDPTTPGQPKEYPPTVLSDDVIDAKVDDALDEYASREWRTSFVLPTDGVKLEDVEYDLILQSMLRTKWNESAAARLVGISRYALRYRLKRFGIQKPEQGGK